LTEKGLTLCRIIWQHIRIARHNNLNHRKANLRISEYAQQSILQIKTGLYLEEMMKLILDRNIGIKEISLKTAVAILS
jgi:hypothetical protein